MKSRERDTRAAESQARSLSNNQVAGAAEEGDEDDVVAASDIFTAENSVPKEDLYIPDTEAEEVMRCSVEGTLDLNTV